jgi:glycine/D-amino acid oxidase-like deaminating enzyme
VETHDVIVIGAGLAGLRAAERLARAGLDVVVLEAADAVGGRQRTDRVDGFLLDRGFQVLNPAYPAVRRWVDTQSLRMRAFPVGVRVRRASGFAVLAHPLRHPRRLPATLRSGLIGPRDAVALARWTVPVLMRPAAVVGGADRALRDGWDRVGLRGPLRTEVLEPFLSGVLAEDAGETSDAFARLLVRMFVLGRPGVPERGIAALPAQLAAYARAAGADIRVSRRVVGLSARGDRTEVSVDDAGTMSARAVLVAVDPRALPELTSLPAPPMKGLQTWWFAAATVPAASPVLTVDGRRDGPIVNTAVTSATAPSYAPHGMHLVQATCVLGAGRPAASEDVVRRQLAELCGAEASTWRLLRRDDIADALPVQPVPLRARQSVRAQPGVYVAGDHRDTASIQGALVSGERGARAIIADLARTP